MKLAKLICAAGRLGREGAGHTESETGGEGAREGGARWGTARAHTTRSHSRDSHHTRYLTARVGWRAHKVYCKVCTPTRHTLATEVRAHTRHAGRCSLVGRPRNSHPSHSDSHLSVHRPVTPRGRGVRATPVSPRVTLSLQNVNGQLKITHRHTSSRRRQGSFMS